MRADTNIKLNTVSTAMTLVLSVLALLVTSVAAQPIFVDGDGSDWDPSWFLAPDPFDLEDYGDYGYNLTGVWQHYNATEDKLYIRYDVVGIAGDSDGNGNPNTPNDNVTDQYGVGGQELYRIQLNTNPTGDAKADYDVVLTYTGNTVVVAGDLAGYTNGNATIDLKPPTFSNVVEFSFDNVSGWLPNPYKYSLYGWVASMMDGPGEDDLHEAICVAFPPVANFTFVAGDCNQTVWFDPSGSYDDDPHGGIVSYTWDFGDGTGEVRDNDSSFTHTFPDTYGVYTVNLTVTDTDDLTGSLVREVMVNRGPIIIDVTADKMSVVEPGELVLFEGWYSDPDGDMLTHKWLVDGTEIASGSSTIYSNASYFVNGPITATLVIEDPHNCTNISSVSVTYLKRPVPVIDYTGTGCLEVELNASRSYDPDGYITTYEWDINNDGVYGDKTGVICTHTFAAGGYHIIGLRVTDDSGLTNTTTRTIYVAYEPTAVADVNQSTVPVTGGWVLFDGSRSTCDALSEPLNYTWNMHGSIRHGVTVPYYVSSNTTAILTVTDIYDCTDTDSVAVSVLPPVGVAEVPSLAVPIHTPAGILALIGLLCIAGAGRIMRRR